jgi:hypothetical protein
MIRRSRMLAKHRGLPQLTFGKQKSLMPAIETDILYTSGESLSRERLPSSFVGDTICMVGFASGMTLSDTAAMTFDGVILDNGQCAVFGYHGNKPVIIAIFDGKNIVAGYANVDSEWRA